MYCVTIALLNLLLKYISWSDKKFQSYRVMRKHCETFSEMPGYVGYLYGTDIQLVFGPAMHGEIYFVRKKFYELNIQTIWKANLLFTYVSTGYALSVGDPTAFATTKMFKSPESFFSRPDEYLLSDKIYRAIRRCVSEHKETIASRR